MSPAPPNALDADLVAFGLLLSGMAGAAAFVVFAVLCITAGGPIGATVTVVRWMWRGMRWDPFPVTTGVYWLTTTASFPAWPAVRVLVTAVWVLVVVCGLVGFGIEATLGAKEVRYFTGPDGSVTREVSRKRPTRPQLPPKMSKAVRAAIPLRDRVAHGMDVRWHARNEARAKDGLPPLKRSWAHRQLVAKLPTGKTKDPRLKGRARTEARRDAVAKVALAKVPTQPKPRAAAARRRDHREPGAYL